MYYKIQDSFGVFKDNNEKNIQWELLLLIVKIKDLINLDEREAEWLVIAIL